MNEENNQFLIIGLGNFGKKYEKNRHNAGFLILDFLIEKLKKLNNTKNLSLVSNFEFNEQKKFFGEICEIKFQNKKFFLLKPLTYMNLSGKSASQLKNFYKIDVRNVFVIHDELDFPQFKSKFKNGGGDGGHNGLKSLTSCFGSSEYMRLRVGVGKPGLNSNLNNEEIQHINVADYVLSDFSEKEIDFLKKNAEFLAENFLDLFLNRNEKVLNKIFQKICDI